MSDIKTLLKSLLNEIYGHSGLSAIRARKQRKKMHPKLYEKRLLQRLNPKVLKDICEILTFEIQLMSKYLERVLITRDKNRTHRSMLCGYLDILVSSKFGESSREMRFGVSSPPGSTQKGRGDASSSATASAERSIVPDDTNSSSDFNQWLHAMKMVARLPGGMPPEFRRKLWLALADKYLKSKNVDWEKEEVKCFSEQWREDDEELGIQIVKDLHRTGSSLCSGPAGTINQAKLKRILLGYARFNPEVGYCQGFNMLGALILQVMDKEEIESIKVMIYLVEGILPSGYFSGSLGGLQADMAVFRELMTSKLPRLAKHLQKLQGPVENAFEPPLTNVFTMQWFLTMFCTCLPMTCVLRVWDLVLIEGSDVLLRTALVLWSLLEERILNARTADDFYCQMGSFSSELLNGHLVDSNGLIEKVVDLGAIPDLQKLRDKHLYNITPFRDKKGLQLYYSDEDGDSDEDSRMAVATAWGLRLRRGSAGLGSKGDGKDRIALDISLLKKQYDRLRERQRQAHIILTSAVARQSSNSNPSPIQMNQLLIGRNAIVSNNGRRLGPPQGAIPPARKPSLPTSKPPKLAQTKKLLSGETLHWRDTDLSKRRRGSLKWKDIRSDSLADDRPAPLIESAPSSRSSSSEPKSRRIALKASRQRSDSSSYSEESDGNSSTSTSLCDEDEAGDHNVSSLEGSPMRKVKSSKKHSEVPKQKSLEDVLNSNDGQPTIDNQIPFIQLTTIESPVLNANKTEIDPAEYTKEDSETESNRLDYAGFVDEFSWPDMNEPTSSTSLEDTTVEATSAEGDFLSLSNVITSTSQLSPMPDITTYINNSNISPLRTPISAFDYASLVENIDEPKKFDVNEEGVTNEYFERVNIVERPTKLDLLYSLNEEDSIRNAYVSCEPSPEPSKDLEKSKIMESEVSKQTSDEERERKMKVLLEYSNKSSLSFIAEAKHEISSGMFKEVDSEFDPNSLKYQPSSLVPLKKSFAVDLEESDDIEENADSMTLKFETQEQTETVPQDEIVSDIGQRDLKSPQICSSPKNLAEELAEIDFQSRPKEDAEPEKKVYSEEIKDIETKAQEIQESPKTSHNIPSTEDLETRFKALEMNFSRRKESLKDKEAKYSETRVSKEINEEITIKKDSPPETTDFSRKSIEESQISPAELSSVRKKSEEDSNAENFKRDFTISLEDQEETKTISSSEEVKSTEDQITSPYNENKISEEMKDQDHSSSLTRNDLPQNNDSLVEESVELQEEEESAKEPEGRLETKRFSYIELEEKDQTNHRDHSALEESTTEVSNNLLKESLTNKEQDLSLDQKNFTTDGKENNQAIEEEHENEKSPVHTETYKEDLTTYSRKSSDLHDHYETDLQKSIKASEDHMEEAASSYDSELIPDKIGLEQKEPTLNKAQEAKERDSDKREMSFSKEYDSHQPVEKSPIETPMPETQQLENDSKLQENQAKVQQTFDSSEEPPIEDPRSSYDTKEKEQEQEPVTISIEDQTQTRETGKVFEISQPNRIFLPEIPDAQPTVDDMSEKNLSDDSKQSLLPKGIKSILSSPTDSKHSNDGALYYVHYPANEHGSEIEGENTPNQPEGELPENQSQEEPTSSLQEKTEKTPVSEVTEGQEKSLVQSSKTEETALQKITENEKEQHFDATTSVDKPLSKYTFSYTQDHFNDHVSFLSEIQSSGSNQQASGALQSTLDLKHSHPNLVAVTTSVSVKNSAILQSSVSIKSSVSLKSSALYDRERGLNVNTGVTLLEDPKLDADNSKIVPSNQLEIKNGRKDGEDSFRINQDLLAGNNRISLNLVKSEYNGSHEANTSNISLSMQLPSYSIHSHGKEPERETKAILPREALELEDKNSSEEKKSSETNVGESSKTKVAEDSQKRKSYSQDFDERLKALERHISGGNFSNSTETKKQGDQPSNEIEDQKRGQISNPTESQPMNLGKDMAPPKVSEPEMVPKEEPEKNVPSTADLEQRFRELERKLSEKNIHLPSKNEQDQGQEASNSSKQVASTVNPSIVLSKNEDTSPHREAEDSRNQEDQQPTTRRRIPSTEDLETRFEALEIQKSSKSPTNLLSPSKIKEDFSVASSDSESKRKSEIPSTEDLENRFQAFEKSKKGDKTPIVEKNGKEQPSDSEQTECQERSTEKEVRSKTKEVPKVTFADSSISKSSEKIETIDPKEPCSERILRKVPSARDLEARFEALEKRKSFTGFSNKTQEYLLAEQSRNYLSSDSINSVEGLKRREAAEKKVASTEDLVLRLESLEQRMAITENSIKNKIASDASHSPTPKNQLPPKPSFECRFEAFDRPKSLSEICSKENSSSRENLLHSRTLSKDASHETKLNLIKRSLFEDKEPEPKWLPSTEDLESRFDALEKQKNKTLSSKKKITLEKEEIKQKPTSYDSQTMSIPNWVSRFEALEHRTPRTSYNKPVPTLEKEIHSKFPSSKHLEHRFEVLEHQASSKPKDFQRKRTTEQHLDKPAKALSSRSIDQVIEQISTKTEEIEREHQMISKVPSTQDLEIRFNDLQLHTKRGDDSENDLEKDPNLEQTTDSIELSGSHKRRDLYKLESQSDETLTVSNPSGTEFDTKSESRPTSCPEYRDPFDSNVVTTDRVLKIIEENSKILHRILKKTLADSGGTGIGNSAESMNSRSGFTDSLLALGNIFPRNDESISPNRMKSQSRVRSTITFRSDDSSITDRLASIKSTIKSIDTLCEDQSSRKDKCQRYIDSLFTTRPSNPTSPTPPIPRPLIKVDNFEESYSSRIPPQDRVALRELKKEVSPRRRRDEDREEYESRVRRDMMPNNVDAPSELSCSLENIAKVDSEVDRINQNIQVESQLERPLSPYYAPGTDLNSRSVTPVVYTPTKLEIRHTTVTSTFYDRYLTEKHIERTFPRSKKHSPVSPTVTKSHLDIANYESSNLDDRSSKSAENSPSRQKDGISPNQTVSAAAYRRSFISSLEVAQKDLHIRSCDNILLQLRSSTTHNKDVLPSIMVYNPLPTKIRKSPELGISLDLYKDYGSDASSKS